jgi:hypothetical protein
MRSITAIIEICQYGDTLMRRLLAVRHKGRRGSFHRAIDAIST